MLFENFYHGSDHYEEVSEFKASKDGYLGKGIYFSEDKNYAIRYATKTGYDTARLYTVDIEVKKPFIVTTQNPAVEILGEAVAKKREQKNSYPVKWIEPRDIKKLKDKGYDAILWDFGYAKEISVFSNENVKIKSVEKLCEPDKDTILQAFARSKANSVQNKPKTNPVKDTQISR